MSKHEILKQIKDAELQVTKGIEEAKKKKERIIAEARLASHEQLERTEARARASQEETIKATRLDIETEKQAIMSQGQEAAQKTRSKAQGRIKASSDRLMIEFKKAYTNGA